MNSVVTPVKVMRGVGELFLNSMKFANNVNRSYSSEFADEGAKIGYTVNARLPQRYRVNKGQALVIQPVNDNIVPITITDQAHIGLEFSMASLKLEIDDYKKRYITPAVEALVNQLDYDGLQRMYLEVWNTVGTPGVVPGTTGTARDAMLPYLAANTKLTATGIPVMGRIAILSPGMHAGLMAGMSGLFAPAAALSANYRTGQFGGAALGIEEWYMDQNLATHVVGPLGGTPLVNGANQTGSTININGWTAAAARRLNKGDVIQFAGVFSVNAMNFQSTGLLQDFTVQADQDSDGAGVTAAVPIKPAIITSGTNQTVTNSPASGAAVTIFGHASAYGGLSSPQALVYNTDAFALVMVDLELPGGVWAAERIRNKALGIAVRFVKAYSVMTDASPARLDIVYGWKAVRPEMAVRISS